MSAKSEQKLRTHEAILQSAARLLRKHGIAGARVADVMKDAGLTVGGFYAHFTSKEALVDDALQRTGAELRGKLFANLEERELPDRIDMIIKRYLSVTHRDYPEGGCAMATVTGEVGLSAPEHRDALGRQLGAFLDALVTHLPSGKSPRRAVALGMLATMIGGVTLARALRGTDLSDEVLRASRAFARGALRDDAHEENMKSARNSQEKSP
jgi:TetR/AcrR family transcriptional repressor of nem operon